MRSDKSESVRKWIVKERFALVPAIFGGLIVTFVAATRGAYGAWLLWIAVPLLMISLGYFFLVNALPILMNNGANHQSDREPKEEPREK